MHPKLVELVERYAETKKHLSDLESATGVLSLTTRTMNDVRHVLDHVLLGIKSEMAGEEEKARYLYVQGTEHLREHALNSYSNVAGRKIKETLDLLRGSAFFRSQERARELVERAQDQYSLGRQKRTAEAQAALEHYKNAAVLALQAREHIQKAPPFQRVRLWIAVLGLLFVVANIILTIVLSARLI